MEKVLLIDAYSIICRGFYALPLLSTKKGFHTNACLGFLNIFFKVVNDENPDYIVVAFDENVPTFRHELYKEYKGQRKPMPTELKEQVPYIKEMLNDMRIPIYSKKGYEADDILGTIATIVAKNDIEAVILSGDRDMLQLATDKIKIRLVKTMNNQSNTLNYYAENVKEEYGVTPQEFIDVKALMGDSSDNIPGLPGIGEKTAFALVKDYKSIDGIYENIDKIEKKKLHETLVNFKDDAYFYKKLVTIVKDAPIEIDINEYKDFDIKSEKFLETLQKYEIFSIYKRITSNNNDTKNKNLKSLFDMIDETNETSNEESPW